MDLNMRAGRGKAGTKHCDVERNASLLRVERAFLACAARKSACCSLPRRGLCLVADVTLVQLLSKKWFSLKGWEVDITRKPPARHSPLPCRVRMWTAPKA